MLRQVLTIIIQANYIEEFDKIIQCRQSRIYTEITQGAYIDTNKQIAKNTASTTKGKNLKDEGMSSYYSENSL